jgi:hypothetical protein
MLDPGNWSWWQWVLAAAAAAVALVAVVVGAYVRDSAGGMRPGR